MMLSKRATGIIRGVFVACLILAQLLSAPGAAPKETVSGLEDRSLTVWYTDPQMQPYMEAAAQAFTADYWVPVKAELVSEVDYIETIFQRSTQEVPSGPDLYVASSELLEKAALAGVVTELDQSELEQCYSKKAVQAVSYKGQPVARPFYIETCFLLYNRYYVEEVPQTIDEILAYAESFEADEVTSRVESIFEWNVADVIDDYLFLGAYMELGGPSGDDRTRVSMDLEKASQCMQYYQNLNSYFAIDADTVSSEGIIQDFIQGRTVFTIVNVPMLAQVDRAVAQGDIPEYATEKKVVNEAGEEETIPLDFQPFYGVARLPALTEELDTRGVSVTASIVVNPYSANRDLAMSCARYLGADRAHRLYQETGKLPACTDLEEPLDEAQQMVYQAYEQAAEVPKIMELSNTWLHLESVLAEIWRGGDIGEQLEGFLELIQEQLR